MAGTRLVMYDDVTVSLLPSDGDAYACYVDGRYANCDQVRAKFPGKQILTIAVFASDDADCLDVEQGDATNAQAPGWVKRQQARGVARPVVYTSAGNATALAGAMTAAGLSRSDYKLWSAHYTGVAHVCGTGGCTYPRADASQWTSSSHGRSLDESLCEPGFFGGAPAPAPTTGGQEMALVVLPDQPVVMLPLGAEITRLRFGGHITEKIKLDFLGVSDASQTVDVSYAVADAGQAGVAINPKCVNVRVVRNVDGTMAWPPPDAPAGQPMSAFPPLSIWTVAG